MKLKRGIHTYRMKRASSIITVWVTDKAGNFVKMPLVQVTLEEIMRTKGVCSKVELDRPITFAHDTFNGKIIFHPTPDREMDAEIYFYPPAHRC